MGGGLEVRSVNAVGVGEDTVVVVVVFGLLGLGGTGVTWETEVGGQTRRGANEGGGEGFSFMGG